MQHYMQNVVMGRGPAIDFTDLLATVAPTSVPPPVEDLVQPYVDRGANAHRAAQALLGNAPPPIVSVDAAFDKIAESLTARGIGENHDLLLRSEALRAEVQQRLNTQASAQQQAAGENYQQLYSEARHALDELNAAKSQVTVLRSRVDHLSGIVSRKHAALRSAQSEKPRPASYPTAGEMEAWKRTVAAAQAEYDAAAADLAIEREALKAARERLEEAQAKFNAIDQQAQVSKARLEGRPIERLGVTIDLSKEEK